MVVWRLCPAGYPYREFSKTSLGSFQPLGSLSAIAEVIHEAVFLDDALSDGMIPKDITISAKRVDD